MRLLLLLAAALAARETTGDRDPPVFGPPQGPCVVQTEAAAAGSAADAAAAASWLCAPYVAHYPSQYTLANATATDERVRELRNQAVHSPVWVTYDEDRSTVGPQRCLDAYTRWMCAQAFPMCRTSGPENATTSVLPCFAVCEDVAARCSPYHQFTCPAREPPPGDEYVVDDYGLAQAAEVDDAAGEWDVGCNSMGLPSPASRPAVSFVALAVAAALVHAV